MNYLKRFAGRLGAGLIGRYQRTRQRVRTAARNAVLGLIRDDLDAVRNEASGDLDAVRSELLDLIPDPDDIVSEDDIDRKIEDAVEEATNERNLARAIESALEGYDFSDDIESAVAKFDFADCPEGLAEAIKTGIKDYFRELAERD